MSIAESLDDLLCHVRVAFIFFGGLLVSLSRSLGGAYGAQAGIPYPFAGLILTHTASLPTNTFADTHNARHNAANSAAARPPQVDGKVVVRLHCSARCRRADMPRSGHVDCLCQLPVGQAEALALCGADMGEVITEACRGFRHGHSPADAEGDRR
jgi:hypothetical protein